MIIKYQYRWFAVSAIVLLADQISKYFAERMLEFHSPVEVMPFFNFMLVYNKGAAFSFLSDAGGWQRWLFTLLALVISAIIAIWITKLEKADRWTALSLSMILGGAIGNLTDRILYGHVIDFIDWFYHADKCLPFFYQPAAGSCHWPTFNIADSSICVGAVILLISSLLKQE